MPEQSVFAVRIAMAGRAGHVHVNGVPIFRNYDGNQVHLQMPVSEFMLTGLNHFGLELSLAEDNLHPQASALVQLVLRENGTPKAQGTVVAEIGLDGPFDSDNPITLPPSISVIGPVGEGCIETGPDVDILSLSREIESNIHIPPWSWSTSEQISDTPKVRDELLEMYRNLWALLSDRKGNIIRDALQEKAQELGAAYYMSPNEIIEMLEIADKPDDLSWRLDDPIWDETQLELAADGHLARLCYYNGTTPIVYHLDNNNEYQAFDIWWRKSRGQWLMTR